jgi:ATP-dependent RNA helicase SUPV3L1/SUV3
MVLRSLPASIRARGVTAVLGPTNTGKTHLAIERLVAHETGMIGLPLRLLAREVYQRVVERAGVDAVALVTGEEKIKPANARFWIATVEAMPRDLDVAFCAIDEIQLAANLDRGHVFTDRLLNQRGRAETLVIGAATMRPLVESLLPGANIVSRPRLSKLSFAGEKKITRLPRRSAIVAFSAEEVYAIAELVRRQKGGAAVVLGSLSPRTRNAQVALYQSGDVDYLVATDAIGMGLNLDLDHVAFAGERKYDGFGFRRLNPAEFGQIAGRAGRHMRDGTFGTTGRCPPFDEDLVRALEEHTFEPVRMAQWRNTDLDFDSLEALEASLGRLPTEPGLTRAPIAEDVAALAIAARDETVRGLARGATAVERLWEVCQVPDYRKVSPGAHADLVVTLYTYLMRAGVISDDWFARQIAIVDRSDGDIDTLSARIAQVRTWTFAANRPDWLGNPEHWQEVTRQVEDRLSDALHERLASRFVDRRTSVLMRRLRENAMLEAEVTTSGDVIVEGQHVGHLQGFQFAPDTKADGPEAKALRNAAQKALAGEIEARAERFATAADETFVLTHDGIVRWTGEAVAKLVPGDKLLEPRLRVLADEHLTGPARDKVAGRLDAWLKAQVGKLLGPVTALSDAAEITGIARGIAFQIAEMLGVLERARVAQDMKGLDQDGRAMLRKHGVRFGAYHIYLPQLLKPAPRSLAVQLWALKHGGMEAKGVDDLPHLAASGRTSIPVDAQIDKALYRAAGFRVCGQRAVRVDILERLADLIRPATAYRPGITPGEPPAGAADGEGFVVTVAMTSLVGCSGDDFASILKSLGYVVDRRAGPAITVPLAALAAPRSAPVAGADTTDGTSPPVPDGGAPSGSDTAAEAAAATAEAPGFQATASQATATQAPATQALATQAPAAQEPASDVLAGSEPTDPASGDLPVDPVPPGADGPAHAHDVAGLDLVGNELSAAHGETAVADPEAAAAVTDVGDAEAAAVAGDAGAAAGDAGAAAGDAGAAAGDAMTPTVEAAVAEPAMIEVWHLHRQHRHDHGHGSRRGERDRRGRRPAPARPAEVAASDGAVAAARAGKPGGQTSQAGRRDEQPRRDGNGPGRFRGDKRGKPGDGKQEKRFNPPKSPPRPEKAPDPNSPFAKLLILKQRLEAGGDDK